MADKLDDLLDEMIRENYFFRKFSGHGEVRSSPGETIEWIEGSTTDRSDDDQALLRAFDQIYRKHSLLPVSLEQYPPRGRDFPDLSPISGEIEIGQKGNKDEQTSDETLES